MVQRSSVLLVLKKERNFFMKKRIISIILAVLALSLLLVSCSNGSTTSQTQSETTPLKSNASCKAIRDEAYSKEKGDVEVHQLYDNETAPMDEFMISGYYGTILETPDFSKLDSYSIFITDEPIVSEFGVFKATADMSVEEIKAFCQIRVDALKKKFEGYKPDMVEAAANSIVGVYGDYVYYISTMENNSAIETLLKAAVDAGKQ